MIWCSGAPSGIGRTGPGVQDGRTLPPPAVLAVPSPGGDSSCRRRPGAPEGREIIRLAAGRKLFTSTTLVQMQHRRKKPPCELQHSAALLQQQEQQLLPSSRSQPQGRVQVQTRLSTAFQQQKPAPPEHFTSTRLHLAGDRQDPAMAAAHQWPAAAEPMARRATDHQQTNRPPSLPQGSMLASKFQQVASKMQHAKAPFRPFSQNPTNRKLHSPCRRAKKRQTRQRIIS